MPYCTQADLEKRYGADEIARISDRAVPPIGTADALVTSEAILQADSEIDGYLGVVVTLPIASVPELIKSISCTIARYRLHEDQSSERVRMDYEDAVRMLKDIAAGRMTLFASGAEISTGLASVRAPKQVFTDDLLGLT